MFQIHSIIKRQIEILALALSPQEKVGSKMIDLADFFGVEELTIKRDLSDLRRTGIAINSIRGKGVCLESVLGNNETLSIILQYAGLCFSENPVLDKPTALLVTKFGPRALSHISLLQLCADRCLKAVIKYNKQGDEVQERKIMPLMVLQNEGSWRVFVQDNSRIKQFLLDKILDVKITDECFDRDLSLDQDKLFGNTWKTWIGSKSICVKLHINKVWADRIKPRILIPNQKLTPQEDGSIIFEASVNSLDEIAGWVVCRGEGIKVLEPKELKEMVIELAKGVLKNYK